MVDSTLLGLRLTANYHNEDRNDKGGGLYPDHVEYYCISMKECYGKDKHSVHAMDSMRMLIVRTILYRHGKEDCI
jgi:hypothetical protein